MDEATILFYDIFLKIKLFIYKNIDSMDDLALIGCSTTDENYLFFDVKIESTKHRGTYIKNNNIHDDKVIDVDEVRCEYIIFLYNSTNHFQSIFKVSDDKTTMTGLYKFTEDTINNFSNVCSKFNNKNLIEKVVLLVIMLCLLLNEPTHPNEYVLILFCPDKNQHHPLWFYHINPNVWLK
jgi:hypothetical protein